MKMQGEHSKCNSTALTSSSTRPAYPFQSERCVQFARPRQQMLQDCRIRVRYHYIIFNRIYTDFVVKVNCRSRHPSVGSFNFTRTRLITRSVIAPPSQWERVHIQSGRFYVVKGQRAHDIEDYLNHNVFNRRLDLRLRVPSPPLSCHHNPRKRKFILVSLGQRD